MPHWIQTSNTSGDVTVTSISRQSQAINILAVMKSYYFTQLYRLRKGSGYPESSVCENLNHWGFFTHVARKKVHPSKYLQLLPQGAKQSHWHPNLTNISRCQGYCSTCRSCSFLMSHPSLTSPTRSPSLQSWTTV